MNRIIAALSGKTFAGYVITTRVYRGIARQSGPSYNTRALAAEQFIARGFASDKTAKIEKLFV